MFSPHLEQLQQQGDCKSESVFPPCGNKCVNSYLPQDVLCGLLLTGISLQTTHSLDSTDLSKLGLNENSNHFLLKFKNWRETFERVHSPKANLIPQQTQHVTA